MNLKRSVQQTPRAMSAVRLYALVLSLLFAQALGFVHGIVHADHGFVGKNQSLQLVSQLQKHSPDAPSSWLLDVFAGHGDESTCQVFDQLSHGSAVVAHVSSPAHLVLASYFLDAYRGVRLARQRSLIQARGPPTVFAAA